MANALVLISHESGIKIVQEHFEKSHSQMDCAIIHSNIEK